MKQSQGEGGRSGLVGGWMSHLSVWKVSVRLFSGATNVLPQRRGARRAHGPARPSGQGPLGDVLLRQVVGHVAAQGPHRHRRHVTGTAVCRATEEKASVTSLHVTLLIGPLKGHLVCRFAAEHIDRHT